MYIYIGHKLSRFMVVGFNHLGKLGRLGNQMFQYAALRGIAAKNGYDFSIPSSEFKDEYKDHQLLKAFQLNGLKNIGFVKGPYIKEKHFHFDSNLYQHMPDGHNIVGYFQSEKYFKNIEKEIREDFSFKENVFYFSKNKIKNIGNPIALHVRRGDYLKFSLDHPLCTKEYYKRALSEFDSDRKVIIFSDDPIWCKDNFREDRFIISDTNDNVIDLCTMSLCNDFIIANSSYSWWGSWLSKNKGKKVIAPKNWFGEGYTKKLNISDLYCPNWKII